MAYSSAPPSFQGLSGASIGSLFTTADYTSLSSASGVHAEIIGRRFNAIPAPRLADFKVPELKEILKWLRGRPNWQTNPYVNQRMSTTAGGNSGKKQQLVDHLKNILQAQAAISRGVNPADLNPNNSSLPSVPSSATLPSQQAYNPAMALQAQYRQQQAHAQAAAARFQANESDKRTDNLTVADWRLCEYAEYILFLLFFFLLALIVIRALPVSIPIPPFVRPHPLPRQWVIRHILTVHIPTIPLNLRSSRPKRMVNNSPTRTVRAIIHSSLIPSNSRLNSSALIILRQLVSPHHRMDIKCIIRVAAAMRLNPPPARRTLKLHSHIQHSNNRRSICW